MNPVGEGPNLNMDDHPAVVNSADANPNELYVWNMWNRRIQNLDKIILDREITHDLSIFGAKFGTNKVHRFMVSSGPNANTSQIVATYIIDEDYPDWENNYDCIDWDILPDGRIVTLKTGKVNVSVSGSDTQTQLVAKIEKEVIPNKTSQWFVDRGYVLKYEFKRLVVDSEGGLFLLLSITAHKHNRNTRIRAAINIAFKIFRAVEIAGKWHIEKPRSRSSFPLKPHEVDLDSILLLPGTHPMTLTSDGGIIIAAQDKGLIRGERNSKMGVDFSYRCLSTLTIESEHGTDRFAAESVYADGNNDLLVVAEWKGGPGVGLTFDPDSEWGETIRVILRVSYDGKKIEIVAAGGSNRLCSWNVTHGVNRARSFTLRARDAVPSLAPAPHGGFFFVNGSENNLLFMGTKANYDSL